MDGEVREVRLTRSESCGYGFSVFGGKGSGFPPVIYDVEENSPAAVSGQLEAGDIILEVNDKKVVSLTTKEVLKSVRLSNDVVTLKVKKDTSIKEQVHNHMAASNELEALRRSNVKENSSNNCQVHKYNSEKSESLGDKENSENIPPSSSPHHESTLPHNHSDIHKSQSRPQQPKFETFMMTGDLIINLNTKTSNSAHILSGNDIRKQPETVIPYGQCSIPTSPEEDDSRLRSKVNKKEASDFDSPVAEKKSNYNYNGNFVRTSRSEDHLQKVSVSAVNIDLEDDVATSLNTLLDTNKDNPAYERIVWSYNYPVSVNGPQSAPCISTTESNSLPNQQSKKTSPSAKFCEIEAIPVDAVDDILETRNSLEGDQVTFSENSESQITYSESESQYVDKSSDDHLTSISSFDSDNFNEDKLNNEMFTSTNRQRYISRSIQPKQDGVTNIIVDENKIYVKVLPDKCVADSELSKFDKLHKTLTTQQSQGGGDEKKQQLSDLRQLSSDMPAEESINKGIASPIEDESDVESLRSFHYSPKAVDMPSASRLAKRLYNLEGFKKSDVSRHLCKNNDFSRVVAEEYLKFFDFNGQTLDIALRKFLKQFCLIGETQERERVLIHFSKRFLDCNPGAFKSQDAAHTLTCALMLLNTDLYGDNVGRRMTCAEFIENLTELNEGENFPKDVLKSLYHSIKSTPLEWAIDDDEDGQEITENHVNSPDFQQSFIGHNPFAEVPNPNCATEYKKGYVMRKCCMDPNGKKTPLGKRGWKMFYATLRDLVLYLHKDENGFRKNQLYDSLHNSIRIHHALATKAVDYTKKQHVFRLQTADQAEYLFQTSDSKELQSWIDTINYVAAILSSPPLPGGVGSSQKKFQRPLLPVSHTKLNFREQLQDIESSVLRLEREFEEHVAHTPDRSAKSRVVHEFVEKEAFLQFELKRYRTYAFLLHSKMAQFPGFEPPLVETSIGEVDESSEKEANPSPVKVPSSVPDCSVNVKRSLSDRYSYRAAIYKTGSSSDGI